MRVTVTFSSPEEIPGTYRRINKGLSSKEMGKRAHGFFTVQEKDKALSKKRYCLAILYTIISLGFAALNADIRAHLKHRKVVLVILLPKATQKTDQIGQNTIQPIKPDETPPQEMPPEPVKTPPPETLPKQDETPPQEMPPEPVKTPPPETLPEKPKKPTAEELFREAEACLNTDVIKARKLYRLATIKKHETAPFEAGRHYLQFHEDAQGNIFLPNYENARAYYLAGALRNDPKCLRELGVYYLGYFDPTGLAQEKNDDNKNLAEKLIAEAERLKDSPNEVLDPEVQEQIPDCEKKPFDKSLPEEYQDNLPLYALHQKNGALENPQAPLPANLYDLLKEDLDFENDPDPVKLKATFNQFIHLLNEEMKKNQEKGIKKLTSQIRLLTFDFKSPFFSKTLSVDIARAELEAPPHRHSYLKRFVWALQKNGYILHYCLRNWKFYIQC